MMQERVGRRASASAISGKRRVMSLPGAAVEPHAVALLACEIVLDLVQPPLAGGQLVDLCGKARRDEPGRGVRRNMWAR